MKDEEKAVATGPSSIEKGDPSEKLEELLRRPGIASEMFFPSELTLWKNERYHVIPKLRKLAPSGASGVRVHAFDPTGSSPGTESEVQIDVVRLVESVRTLREEPELAKLVISNDSVKAVQLGHRDGRRLKFGLQLPSKDGFRENARAARVTQRRIVSAMKRAGFVVDEPSAPFDSRNGFEGLSQWASKLRLRRKRNYLRWIVAALLPLLFLSCLSGVPEALLFPGEDPFEDVTTNSVIIILDDSNSMYNPIPKTRGERPIDVARSKAERYLKARKGESSGPTNYVDCIRYNDNPNSPLNKLTEVDNDTIASIDNFLKKDPKDTSDLGTNLGEALKKAAAEVAAHKKPTTLVILTDGEDDTSINELNSNPAKMKALKAQLNGVELYVKTVTPRRLNGVPFYYPRTTEQSKAEEGLAKLSKSLNEHPGTAGGAPSGTAGEGQPGTAGEGQPGKTGDPTFQKAAPKKEKW